MRPPRDEKTTALDPWASFEPYAQLIRSLLPRSRGVTLFDSQGERRWGSEPTSVPELMRLVGESLGAARAANGGAGLMSLLPGNAPVYLCWLRDDAARLIAGVTVECRAIAEREVEAGTFDVAHALLKPALECMRRDLLSRATIDRLSRAVDALDKMRSAGVESSYDTLTGLYTRPAFEQRVRTVVSRAKESTPWSALYIDADQLHVVNDSFGMHVGDSVLGQLGELVRSRLPKGGFAARISGDRFSVLLPASLDDAERFAESLRAGAERLGSERGNSRLRTSISVGVASLDTGAGELMHSLAAAETACKAAKDRGRNRVEVYRANDASLVRRFTDINIAGQVSDAINAGRLQLDAQLILPFAGGGRLRPHYELLVRMLDEDGTATGPDSFLSAAMRYQLMASIDRWVIERALERLAAHAARVTATPLAFAINFSGQSLNDDGFAEFLVKRIAASGLDPQLLCFELTESAMIANIARARALMRRLRAIGCGVALDDFGTGFSSLAYLRQLPVTMLKIDGSFVRDVLRDTRAESMVRAIAQLARTMSLATVAEYVESDEIRERIATLGVDFGQGFAIAKPVGFEELLADLPRHTAALAGAGAQARTVARVVRG
jgi:diguanylate cyclase (GGDEF)-like protein